MNLRQMVAFCALALGALTVGCGNDCKSSCEDGKDCKDATADQKALDCDKTCDDLDDLGDASDCSDKIDDYMSCESDLDDQCKDDSKCDSKGTAMFDCIGKYCTAHPSDGDCAKVYKDLGLTAQ